jgi:DNA-binding SARP family transcriptional activator
MDSTSAVQIRFFGAPEIRRDGVTVQVDTRKAVALLAYLAVAKRPVSRDQLCGLFWPESSQSRARGALRRTLSTARSVVGGEVIVADRESVLLDASPLNVDVLRFGALASGSDPGHLREAARLYAGDFLAGFAVRGSPEFEDWHRMEADRLRRAADEVFRRAAEASAEAGDTARAIELSQRRIEIDPLNEPAHRALMVMEARGGRRSSAINRYREMVRVLDEELGVAPLDETKQVYEAIRRGRYSEDAPPTPVVAASEPLGTVVASQPALIGRDEELRALVDSYSASAKSGRLLAIAGEAGIGKSRLASAIVERAQQVGGVTALVRCHEGERDLPYAPLTELLRELIGQGGGDGLAPAALAAAAALVPEMSSASLQAADLPAGPEARTRFLEALRTALVGLATQGTAPGLVVFDDLHLADDATIDLVSYTARRLKTPGVALLVTWRTGAAMKTRSPVS